MLSEYSLRSGIVIFDVVLPFIVMFDMFLLSDKLLQLPFSAYQAKVGRGQGAVGQLPEECGGTAIAHWW